MRISRIRLSDERRLQAHATSYVQATSPEGQACSRIAWSFFGGNRLAPLSNPLFPSQACPKSGPFPPPALPGITGTTSLSATPFGPACPSRVSGWCLTTTAGASRVASDLPLYTCRRQYPGGTVGCTRCCLFFSNGGGLPRLTIGSAPALQFSRLAQRSLRVTACILAESPCDPLHRRLRRFRYLRPRSGCYRLKQPLSGGTFTH